MTTPLNLDELEAKARAATGRPNDKTRAKYFAAASPDVVIALCARVRELEEGLRAALNMVSDMWRDDPVYRHLRALLGK